MEKAYILNTITRIAHQRRGLTEECNTDQIVKRRDSHTIPKTYHLCEHEDWTLSAREEVAKL